VHSDVSAQAKCLLQLARLELLANRPDDAVQLVQSAQALGGDLSFWCQTTATYTAARGAMKNGAMDVDCCYSGTIEMLQDLARWDRRDRGGF